MESSQLLTVRGAAALLQRYMPSRDALSWLLRDTTCDPVIPFVTRDNQLFYRRADVVSFAINKLGAPTRIAAIEDMTDAERRRRDRRMTHDRRRRLEVPLAPGIERRRYAQSSRRFGNGYDRRADS